HPAEKIEVAADAAAAEAHRKVVLDLSRNEDAPSAGRPFDAERPRPEIVFRNAAGDELSDQAAGTRDQRGIEFGVEQHELEIAAHIRIEMHAPSVEHERRGRHEI